MSIQEYSGVGVDWLTATTATQIWCWVDREWDDIRIYTYYLLIWICIVGSLILYFMVGYHVFRFRNQLRSFPTTTKSREAVQHDGDVRPDDDARTDDDVRYFPRPSTPLNL